MAQLAKNLPAVWETWVRSLGWEDLLEEERLPTPVFWPGEFHGLYSPWGCKESDTTERLSLTLHSHSSWIDFLNLWMSQSNESQSSFQTITEEPGKSCNFHHCCDAWWEMLSLVLHRYFIYFILLLCWVSSSSRCLLESQGWPNSVSISFKTHLLGCWCSGKNHCVHN